MPRPSNASAQPCAPAAGPRTCSAALASDQAYEGRIRISAAGHRAGGTRLVNALARTARGPGTRLSRRANGSPSSLGGASASADPGGRRAADAAAAECRARERGSTRSSAISPSCRPPRPRSSQPGRCVPPAPAASRWWSIADRATRQAGLVESLTGSEAGADGSLRTSFRGVPFDAFAGMLASLDTLSSIAVQSAEIESTGEPGKVNATVVLRPAPPPTLMLSCRTLVLLALLAFALTLVIARLPARWMRRCCPRACSAPSRQARLWSGSCANSKRTRLPCSARCTGRCSPRAC